MENLVIQAKKKFTLDKFISNLKFSDVADVKDILNISAKVVVSSVEKVNNIVSVSGKVVANIIYLNFENMVSSAEMSNDFVNKQQLVAAISDVSAKVEASIKIDAVMGSEIMCSVTHNTDIFGIYKYEIADFVGENTAFVLNKKSFNCLTIAKSVEDNFVVAEEVESNILNMKVLSSRAKVVEVRVSSGVEKVLITGKIVAETIYTDGEAVQEILKEFEFKQEVEANSVSLDMIAEADLEVKNITVTPEEKENKTNIIYAVDVYAKVYVYEAKSYDVATDMFSLENEIQNTYDYIELRNYSSSNETTDVVMSSTNVSEIENFDDIVGVYMPKVQVKSIISESEKAYAECEVQAFALYKSDSSVKRLEVVYPAKLEFSKAGDESAEFAKVEAEISSFKVKAGKELEVAFRLNGVMTFTKTVSESYIKAFEIKDAKRNDEGGIKVYITKKGETIFDVAKVLSVRPEVILEQNEVDDVFEQGEKIYVYSPINCM